MRSSAYSVEEALDLMAESSEALRRALEQHQREHSDPVDLLPVCAMGDLGREVAMLQRESRAEELRAVFQAAERLMLLGDQAAQTAVATGFLECVIHQCDGGAIDPVLLWPMVGPECRQFWRAYDRLHGCSTRGLEDDPD